LAEIASLTWPYAAPSRGDYLLQLDPASLCRRALNGVAKKCAIYPGIDIDIPTGANEKQTAPEDVYAATAAGLKAGAEGLIFSRKYSEMRLANLAAGGKAVRDFGG